MKALPRGNTGRSFLLTLIAVLLVAAFLSPLLRAAMSSIKSTEQMGQSGSPLYPADVQTFSHGGEQIELFKVPIDGTVRELGLLKRGRTQSDFIDPDCYDRQHNRFHQFFRQFGWSMNTKIQARHHRKPVS